MRPRLPEPNERLLVHLSNFRAVKRIQDVVTVFARVAKAMPARLMLIGDGPDRSVAEYLARENNVQDRIHFVGKQDNVNELLPLADLMLIPARWESFGLAAARSDGLQRPTIATRVGGVPELIEHGHNGLLFPVGDTESMSTAAISLLSDQHRLEAMAKAAAKPHRTTSVPPASSRSYEDYYDRVVTAPNQPLNTITPSRSSHSPHRILHQVTDRLPRRAANRPHVSAPASRIGISIVTFVPRPGGY